MYRGKGIAVPSQYLMVLLRSKLVHARQISDLSRFLPQFEIWMDFAGEALDSILANKMQDFLSFILHNCILIFDTEQFYKKHQF